MKNLLLLLVAASCLTAFAQISLTGKWVGHLALPNSTDSATLTYTLRQSGDSLSGSVTGPEGSVDIEKGKVDGHTFSFSIVEAYGEAKITGTRYDDSLSSNVTLPQGKVLHLRLVRAQ